MVQSLHKIDECYPTAFALGALHELGAPLCSSLAYSLSPLDHFVIQEHELVIELAFFGLHLLL